MNYYFISIPQNPSAAFVENFREENIVLDRLDKGLSLRSEPPLLSGAVSPKSGSEMPDMFPSPLYFLISDRLKSILYEAEPNLLEFYPVIISDKRTDRKFTYYLVNILHLCDAMDRSESDVDWSPSGTPLKIRKMKLSADSIQERNIFQILPITNHIFVSETLVQKIEAAGITGIRFLPLESFTFGIWPPPGGWY